MKNILIVDDSAEIRETLSKLLKTIDGLIIAGEADNYPSAINNFENLKPDTVILDIDLPIGNGIDILTEMKKIDPNVTIIMFTNYSNHTLKKMAIKQGADFFLDKSSDIDKLTEILTELAN